MKTMEEDRITTVHPNDLTVRVQAYDQYTGGYADTERKIDSIVFDRGCIRIYSGDELVGRGVSLQYAIDDARTRLREHLRESLTADPDGPDLSD